MAMDTIFDFDNQEYVSDVKVFRDFFDSAVRSHNHSKSFGFTIGDKDFWESGFISTLLHPSKKDNGCPRGSKELIDSLVLELRHPMKQYNFDKDDGRGRIALPKRAHLICMNSLLAENEKKRNPQYKSIVLRSMQYDRFDISVICNTVRGDKTEPSCSLKSGGIRNGDMNRIHETLSGEYEALERNTQKSPRVSFKQKEVVVKVEDQNSDAYTKVYTLLDNFVDSRFGKCQPHSLEQVSGVDATSRSTSTPFYYPYEEQSFVTMSGSGLQGGLDDSDSHQHVSNVSVSHSSKAVPDDLGAEPMSAKIWRPDWRECEAFTSLSPTTVRGDCFRLYHEQQLTNSIYFAPFYDSVPFSDIDSKSDRENSDTHTIPLHPQPQSRAACSLIEPSWIFASHGLAGMKRERCRSDRTFCVSNDTKFLTPLISSASLEITQSKLCPSKDEQSNEYYSNDIVAQVSVHVGYPRPLEKQEVRLGRLLKVLDRFLILGSNTLKDLKNAIECPSDNHVFEDVSERPVSNEDLCKNRYPSSYFFFHDTFYVDVEAKTSYDITSEVRSWALERGLGKTEVADMNTTRIVDLKCRLGAPYLYLHVGACEHLITFNNVTLRDTWHPNGLYPLPIFERNSRRIACAGCKEVTAGWVVWEHENMPSPIQYFCDSCYKDFNFNVHEEKLFAFKAAPLYDRHNRKTDFALHASSAKPAGVVKSEPSE
ncbi:hypothetical protein V3C99_005385 [Haemonchus contortus]